MNSKRTVQCITAACLFAAGGITATLAAPATQPAAAPPPAAPASAAAELPVATVNGRNVDTRKFDDLLMQVAGLRVFQEVLDLVLVQQACTDAMIPVQGDDFNKLVQTELDRTLAKLGDQGVPEKDRPAVLSRLLQEKGVTEVEFQMGLQRAAGLRQLAKGRIEPATPAEIKEAYIAQYGEKVQVEILTVPTMIAAAAIRKQIEGGEEPKAAAQARAFPWQQVTISSNNTDGEPISQFKELGFKELKEHQLSATIPSKANGGDIFYMVYLDKKIPADPTPMATVEKKLEDKVRDIKEENWMQQELQHLRAGANVKINDPILVKEAQNLMDNISRMRAASQPGATQPAATMPK